MPIIQISLRHYKYKNIYKMHNYKLGNIAWTRLNQDKNEFNYGQSINQQSKLDARGSTREELVNSLYHPITMFERLRSSSAI